MLRCTSISQAIGIASRNVPTIVSLPREAPWLVIGTRGAAGPAGKHAALARRHGRRPPSVAQRHRLGGKTGQAATESTDRARDKKLQALRRFETEIRKPDHDIDLTRAAALLALHAEPNLDLEATVFRPLAELSKAFCARNAVSTVAWAVNDESRPWALAASLCNFILEQGFHGCGRSEAEYYRAENSLLNHVLKDRVGIPISLSLVYMSIGRECGLDLHGVNFPGHFFLGFGHGKQSGLVDSFENRVVGEDEAAKTLGSLFGQRVKLDPGWQTFPRMRNTSFLHRMVRNLENVYKRDGNSEQAALIAQYSQLLEVVARQEL